MRQGWWCVVKQGAVRVGGAVVSSFSLQHICATSADAGCLLLPCKSSAVGVLPSQVRLSTGVAIVFTQLSTAATRLWHRAHTQCVAPTALRCSEGEALRTACMA